MAAKRVNRETKPTGPGRGGKTGPGRRAKGAEAREAAENAEPAPVREKEKTRGGARQGAGTTAATSKARGGKTEAGRKSKGKGPGKASRRKLLESALERVRRKLESEEEPTHSTIGNLVQLLKLDRDWTDDDETPHEIRVLWQETNGESSSGE